MCIRDRVLLPTWAIPKDHKVTKALEKAYTGLYGDQRIGAADTLEMMYGLKLASL